MQLNNPTNRFNIYIFTSLTTDSDFYLFTNINHAIYVILLGKYSLCIKKCFYTCARRKRLFGYSYIQKHLCPSKILDDLQHVVSDKSKMKMNVLLSINIGCICIQCCRPTLLQNIAYQFNLRKYNENDIFHVKTDDMVFPHRCT